MMKEGRQQSMSCFLCHDWEEGEELSSAVPFKQFDDYSNYFSPRHQMYVVDACHAGAALCGARATRTWEESVAERPGIHAMTAVHADQQALEDYATEHGVFTKFFLEAINPDPANNGSAFRPDKRMVLASTVFDNLREKVFYVAQKRKGDQEPTFGRLKPVFLGENVDGEMIPLERMAKAMLHESCCNFYNLL